MEGVSVCIPVGPDAWYKKYLTDCLESVMSQTLRPIGVTIIDDMAGITEDDLKPLYIPHKIWRTPWLLGIPGCANVGIALGMSDLVFQLSCDDRLMPECLEECWKEWEHRKDPLGYYWVGVEYSTGEKQALPCGHAMVPKALWRHTGGFPPETAVGGCDPAFISMMLSHAKEPNKMGTLYSVAGGRPLYWHREHEEQYTKKQHVSPGAIIEVRKWFTDNWKPPKWGRYEP